MTLQEKGEPEIEIPLTPAIAIPYGDPLSVPEMNSSIVPPEAAVTSSTISTATPQQPTKPPPATRTVDVIAPSDLPAGYEFYVDDATTPHVSLLVQVPAGGVRATQRFAAIVIRELNRGSHNIPHGKWRDGIWDCWSLGCCHPQWCLTFWCTPCALGQVLTRLKLNACASPKQAVDTGFTAFQILFALQVVSIVVNFLFSVVGYPFLKYVFIIMMFIFILIVTLLLRRYVRNKYQIPEKTCCCKEDGCCSGYEDFCCAFWCAPCTICQLARHTADYHRHQAGCCTEDGLSMGTPWVV